MADDRKPLQVDRRSEPRESLNTGFDPYLLSLLPDSRSEQSPGPRNARSDPGSMPADRDDSSPTRHRSALVRALGED